MIPEILGHRVEFSDGYVAPIIAWSAEGRPMVVCDDELAEVNDRLLGRDVDYRVIPPLDDRAYSPPLPPEIRTAP